MADAGPENEGRILLAPDADAVVFRSFPGFHVARIFPDGKRPEAPSRRRKNGPTPCSIAPSTRSEDAVQTTPENAPSEGWLGRGRRPCFWPFKPWLAGASRPRRRGGPA